MGCSCGTGGSGQLVLVGEGSISINGSGTSTDPFRVGNGGASSTLQLEVRDSSTVNMSLFGSGTKNDPYVIRADTSSASSLRGLSDVSASPAVQQGAVPLWIGSVAGGRFEFRLPGTRYTTNANRGNGTYPGEVIKETDTGNRYEWDGTQWVNLAPATVAPSALDPSVVQNQGTVATSTDWNSLTTKSGIYRIGGWDANKNTPPNAYNYGTLVVFLSGNSVTQTYYSHQTALLYQRTKYNASDWTGWTRAGTIDEINAEITNRQSDVNDVRNNKVFDIARIGHSGYNNGGLNGFWQGYLPDNYRQKGDSYSRSDIDSAFSSRDGRLGNLENSRATWSELDNRTRIASGAVAGMNSGGTVSVGFPSGRFTTLPQGIATGIYTGSSANQQAGIINASSGGFTLYYFRDGGGGNATVSWIAVQTY